MSANSSLVESSKMRHFGCPAFKAHLSFCFGRGSDRLTDLELAHLHSGSTH